MRVCFRTVALLFAVASLISARANPAVFALTVTASPNPVAVSNAVTYSITISNQSASILPGVTLTNIFNKLVQVTLTNLSTTNWSSIYDIIGDMPVGESTNISFAVTPITTGTLSNLVFVATTNGLFTSTNVAVSVVAQSNANLNVAIGKFSVSGFASAIFVNDQVTYSVTVTNASSSSAANVFLTNSLPGITFLNVSPTNQAFVTDGSNFVFNLGTIAGHASKIFQLTIQPTNSGVFPITASVVSTNQPAIINSSTSNLTVLDFLVGTSNLVVYTNSGQFFDRQTGREEQFITLSNAGPSNILSARVTVSGLTNRLFNAVGTNDGNPFVVCGAPLATNESVDLTLQFFPTRTNFPFSNSQLSAQEVTTPDFSLPATGITSTNINSVLISNLPSVYFPSGHVILVEFKAITNRTYTIAYKDSMASTNWLAAQPPFHTTANYVLWIDYGPPETLSNSPMRFYRVYLNPKAIE